MTERTVTSVVVANRTPYQAGRELHVAYGYYNFGTAPTAETVSATLVVQLVDLPNRAVIQDLWVKTIAFGGTGGYVVGDASLSNRFITAASMSADPQVLFMNQPGGANYTVSFSQDRAVQPYYTINFTLNGAPSATASGCVAITVYYNMADPA